MIIFQFLAIQKIRGAMLLAKEKPIASFCALQRSLLQVSAKGRQAGPRADHDDVSRIIFRQPKGARLLHVHWNVFYEQLRVIGEEPRREPLFGPAQGLISNHGNAKVRLAWMGLKR